MYRKEGEIMKHLNKMLSALLVLVLLLSLAVPALAADVQRSGQKLSVDGVEIDCEKYNIDGSNYFKLRDLAALLSGTGSAFAVDWDAERGAVSITTGQDYTKVGGELEVGADNSASAQVSAQTDLGYCYSEGLGVEQDRAAAVEWFRKAAKQGYVYAQTNLGICYYEGLGVERDYAAAVKWYRKAAEQGDPKAQNNLGTCYGNGYGVEQDYAAAAEWLRKAAEQGHAAAQYNLGDYYYWGKGVKQDYTAAVEWFHKAAGQGEPRAQYFLGMCYEFGLGGLSADSKQAKFWYNLAAEQDVTGDDD